MTKQPSCSPRGLRLWLLGTLIGALALLAAPIAQADTTVEGWGSSGTLGLGGSANLAPTPLPEVADATAAAVGRSATYYLTPRGVFSTRTSSPFTSLLPNTAGATAVATGGTTTSTQEATLILQADGTVLGFGNNTYGSAGGTPAHAISTPTQIAGLSNVTAIACGTILSVALESDGTVWAWGYGSDLGNPAMTANTGTPQQVQLPTGSGQKAVAIAVGGGQSLALLEDGSVWAWGNDANGQVGNGSTAAAVTTPVQVIDPPATQTAPRVVQIGAGQASSYALYSDGTFQAWGSNAKGQLGLGRGSTSNVLSPAFPEAAAVSAHPDRYPKLAEITGAFETTLAIVAGNANGAARRVLVWGDNSKALLGFGTGTPTFDFAWPYNPASPNTAGASTQGATEIPQFLGKLKGVPWLGIGGSAYIEVAPTEPTLRPVIYTAVGFFSHPVGTISGAKTISFESLGDTSTVTAASITGPDAEDFEIVGHHDTGTQSNGAPFPIALPANGYFSAYVRFHPTDFGERFATLTVTTPSESTSLELNGYGAEFPGNTPGATGGHGATGATGPAGPAGPAGKDGVVVFTSTQAKVNAKRGKRALLSFLLVNGTTANLTGSSVSVSATQGLGSASDIAVSSLAAGASRHLAVPLRVGRHARLGSHLVRVRLKLGDRTVSRTISVRVRR